ncbi:6-O-methylguanine DNA methyltransferase [Pseudomonas aeruginosa]|nr:6-O-methylguanine DNA methyltransferase [Pseudomonas aeruginosa]
MADFPGGPASRPAPAEEAAGNSSARTGVLALEGRTSLRASSAATGEPP